MRDGTALLVSTDPQVVAAVEASNEGVDHLRLEVCRGADEARVRLQRGDVVLVLVHHASAASLLALTRFVAEVSALQRPCATVVLSPEYNDHQAVAFLRAGASDFLGLPVDRGRLAYLI
jgi:DNA-binding NtrC family response regulator